MIHNIQNAIISVTYRCNSQCITCDIWKKKKTKEVPPAFYRRLPSSLKDINLTGGEPFLRNDLPEIVKVIKETCPKARIIINTNGLLSEKTIIMSKKIVKIDPKIAIRVSIDGLEKTHDQMRGMKRAFQKATETLEKLKKIPVKDLGISFTLTDQNKNQLLKVYEFSKKNKWQFSLTVATNSEIYFGHDKEKLRPKFDKMIEKVFFILEKKYYQSLHPKDWFRGWFAASLRQYLKTGKRPFPCDAGKNFFYLDPSGNVFSCHLKNWPIGNLGKNNFEEIWFNERRKKYQKLVNKCQDCWMICTAKTAIENHMIKVLSQVIIDKIKASFGAKNGVEK